MRSVLGEEVQVGDECRIEGSYVFEGCKLGNGARIKDSVVGEGVSIAEGAIVENGSLIGSQVRLGKGAKVSGMRVSSEEYDGDVESGDNTRESRSISAAVSGD